MATYNFDKIINRKGTNCLKYDYAVERGKPADCAATVGCRHGLYSIGGDYEKPSRGGRSWNLRITPSLRMLIIMP